MMKINTISIYCSILTICYLNLFGFVHAQTTPKPPDTADVKIDFARVQEIAGENPNKTAACIIAWVADDAKEAKVFCRYELDKKEAKSFLRDNNSVNKILVTKKLRNKTSAQKLLPATSKNFPGKIKGWLDKVEKSLSGKKLPPIQEKITKLFADFVEQGVKEYSAYSGHEEDLFKNTKPYDLVLSKTLDDSYEAFAILAHYKIHRAIVKSILPPDAPNKNNAGLDDNNKSTFKASPEQTTKSTEPKNLTSSPQNTTIKNNTDLNQNFDLNQNSEHEENKTQTTTLIEIGNSTPSSQEDNDKNDNGLDDNSESEKAFALEQIRTSINNIFAPKNRLMLLTLCGILLLLVVVAWLYKKSRAALAKQIVDTISQTKMKLHEETSHGLVKQIVDATASNLSSLMLSQKQLKQDKETSEESVAETSNVKPEKRTPDSTTSGTRAVSQQEVKEAKLVQETIDKLLTETSNIKTTVDAIAAQLADTVAQKEMKLDEETSHKLVTAFSNVIPKTDAIAAQLADTVAQKEMKLGEESKTALAKAVLDKLLEQKTLLKKEEIEQIAEAVSQQELTLTAQSKQDILNAISEQQTENKQEVLTAISGQTTKIQQLRQSVENRERSRTQVEQQLTKTQQNLAKTENERTNVQAELHQTQNDLANLQKRYDRMTNSLQTLIEKRFGVKSDSTEELLAQLNKQDGTWQWLQNILVGQYQAYKKAVSDVQVLRDPQSDKILKLLNIDSIHSHWHEFVKDNPYFESDQKLLGRIRAIDSGVWLSNVLRADDLLKTYFADKPQLKPLATHIAHAAIMLQVALQELGVKVIKPELLEKPPEALPKSVYKKASNELLMELTHKKVMSKLSDTEPKLVVDVEKYGFATKDNPQPDMKILIADLGGWEFFKKD